MRVPAAAGRRDEPRARCRRGGGRAATQTDTPLAPVTEDPRYIGTVRERPGVRRLVQGQGAYVDDVELPRMAHVVYWRSPLAHCRILRIDAGEARGMPGVVLVADGRDIATSASPGSPRWRT